VNWSQKFKDLQIPLESDGREYLKWDSYVDCARIYQWTYQELKTIIEAEPEDLTLIIEKVKNASTISPKLKRKFGLI